MSHTRQPTVEKQRPDDQTLLSHSATELARTTGIPRSTLYGWQQELRLRDVGSDTTPPGWSPPENDEEYLSSVAALAREITSGRGLTQLAEIDLSRETKPVGIAFTGDWHWGGLGVDYGALYRDLKLLEQFPSGLWVFGMGDYGDNYKAGNGRTSSGLYEAVVANPDDQQRGWMALLSKINPKLLGLTIGCHLDWDYQKAGRDPIAVVCALLNKNDLGSSVLNLSYGSPVKIKLGDQEYYGLVRHKLYGESALSTTNSQRRATNEYPADEQFDFVALAHRHYNDLQVRTVSGRQRVWLRSGAYKVYDRHGQAIGGYVGEPGIPILILWPNTKRMVAFWGPHLPGALTYLAAMRS